MRLQPEKRERARLRPEKKGRMDLAGDEGEGRTPVPATDGGDEGGGGRRGRNRVPGCFFCPVSSAPALVGDKIFCIAVTSNVRNAKRHMPC